MAFNSKYNWNSPDYEPDDSIYTPEEVFERLGLTFDLDVCAPTGGLPWIPAKDHYDIVKDGLVSPWYGRVWCNPPYSKPKPWIEKMVAHNHGIMLCTVAKSLGTDLLWKHSTAIALMPGRFKFTKPNGTARGIFLPVALYAFGDDCAEAVANSGYNRAR